MSHHVVFGVLLILLSGIAWSSGYLIGQSRTRSHYVNVVQPTWEMNAAKTGYRWGYEACQSRASSAESTVPTP